MNHEAEYIDLTRQAPFALGSLDVRPLDREVVAGHVREDLEPRVMQVLVALARRPGEVVSRDDLIAQCWAGRVVGDDAINRCVGRLRRLSETIGGFELETLPRVGYRLNVAALKSAPQPETAPVFAPPPPPSGNEKPAPADDRVPPQPQSKPHPKSKPKRRVLLWAMAVLLLAAAGLAYFTLAPKSKAPRSFSIAVLPLTPLYEDASAQHLGDSIAASVADMLSGYGLDVVSPAKSFQFRGADKARANGALHADFIIDGEVRRERGNYLVAIRIVAGESGTTLLAENFERPVSQEADLPENIAGEVAELEWYVTTGFGRSALWDRRVMAGALRATHLLRTRADASAANDIARHLEEIAPDDPYAYAVHVRTALQMTADMPTGHKEAFLAEARRAAAKAVRLDPSYADGYALQAMTVPSIDWLEHDHAYKRALTIMPKAPIAYTLAVEFLQNTGRFKESVRLAEEAYAANPYLADINIKTANSRLWSGQTQLASDLIRRGSHLFSRGTWFPAKQFEAAAFYGAPGTAGALLQDASIKAVLDPADGPQVFAAVAAALKSQRPSDIDVVVKDCANPDDLSPAQERTCLLALSVLGRIDAAFKLTDALYPDQRGASAAERDRKWLTAPVLSTAYLLTPPAARLRADPRFLALVERIGLYGYWKAAHIRPDFCDSEKVAVCR